MQRQLGVYRLVLCAVILFLICFSGMAKAGDPSPAAITPPADPDFQCIKEDDKAKFTIVPWFTPDQPYLGKDVDENAIPNQTGDDSTPTASPATPSAEDKTPLKEKIINGTTDFVIERAQDEVSRWVTADILHKFCDGGENEPLQTLFKTLCGLNKQFGRDSNAIVSEHTALINAFRQDLEALPSNLVCGITKTPDEKRIAYLTYNIMLEVRKGARAENLIAGLAENAKIQEECDDKDKDGNKKEINKGSCELYLSGAMMQSFIKTKAKNLKKKADNIDSFKKALNDKLDEDSDKIGTQMVSTVKDAIKDASQIESLITVTNYTINDIKKQRQLINSASKTSEMVAPALTIINDTAQLMKKDYEVIWPLIGKDKNPNIIDAFDMVSDATSGRYSEAFTKSGKLINAYGKTQCEEIKKKFPSSLKEMNCKDTIVGSLNSYHAALEKFEKGENIPPNDIEEINKQITSLKQLHAIEVYGGVFAKVASSKTSDDAKAALGQVASPVGGWRLKRENSMLSIGAMFGAFGGAEFVRSAGATQSNGRFTPTAALFVPIGVDYTHVNIPGNLIKTTGVLLSIFDLGSVANARLTGGNAKGDTKNSSNTGATQLVSPGLYLHFNAGKSPFVWGIGGSYTPQLRTVNVDGGEKHGAYRVGLFIAVDLMLFPFKIF